MQYDVETDKRVFSVYPGRDRVPARIVHSTSGEAVPFDGFVGVNGVPSSIQDGRILYPTKAGEGKERRREGIMKYPLSTIWVGLLLLAGILVQVGWH